MHNRENALKNWLDGILQEPYQLIPITGDASFRRYYRLHYQDKEQIVMDAPPEKESVEPFINVAKLLEDAKIKAPLIYAYNSKQGFALLEDFGNTLFYQVLQNGDQDRLYQSALDNLVLMQTCNTDKLPAFDNDFIDYELNVFKDWFCSAYLGLKLSHSEEKMIDDSFQWLKEKIISQPTAFIHRDYHSRNIMILEDSLGIIDFQDAMRGPFTYDLASLLKDCYIQWPREQILNWLAYFYQQSTIAQQYSFNEFIKAFDYCGLQRHLKVLGVFCRLHLRDNKPNYLNDLPLTLHYVLACVEGEKELAAFYQFLQERVQLP